jgi:hypothetical protein
MMIGLIVVAGMSGLARAEQTFQLAPPEWGRAHALITHAQARIFASTYDPQEECDKQVQADVENLYLKPLGDAMDASGAVEAYAAALSAGLADLRIKQAYVDKMADLGKPELAFDQAKTLVDKQVKDGKAWAVVAAVENQRGRMVEALWSVVGAWRLAPNDPFVQQTAGKLMAWYDTKGKVAELPEGLRKVVATIDKDRTSSDLFGVAYRQAQAGSTAAVRARALTPYTGGGASPSLVAQYHYPQQPVYSYVPPPTLAPQNVPGAIPRGLNTSYQMPDWGQWNNGVGNIGVRTVVVNGGGGRGGRDD